MIERALKNKYFQSLVLGIFVLTIFSSLWAAPRVKSIEEIYGEGVTFGNSERTVIAVFDLGIDYNHPTLAANIWRDKKRGIIGFNGVNPQEPPYDEDGHGTYNAGIVRGLANSQSLAPDPDIFIMPVKYSVSDPKTILKGLEFIEKQKEVKICFMGFTQDVNEKRNRYDAQDLSFFWNLGNSWSPSFIVNCCAKKRVTDLIEQIEKFYKEEELKIKNGADFVKWYLKWENDLWQTWDKIEEKIRELKNILFVFPAPNNPCDLNKDKVLPANINAPHVLTVSALNEKDELWEKSAFGEGIVDLAVRGIDIRSTLPDESWGKGSGCCTSAAQVAFLAGKICRHLSKTGQQNSSFILRLVVLSYAEEKSLIFAREKIRIPCLNVSEAVQSVKKKGVWICIEKSD